MKKVVAALVALAMILAMAPAVFAVTDSGNWMIAAGASQDWTATASGSVSLTSESGNSIAVLDAEGSYLTMGPNPSFDAVEGETYTIQHFGSGFDIIYWELTAAGGGSTGETSGTLNIEAYGNADWTAPQDGYVQFTINISGATLSILNGFSPLAEGTDSITAQVTAGTTYMVAPGFDVTVDSVISWEYVAGGEGGEGGSGSTVDTVFELGDNAAVLAAGDADGETFTYTATESGDLTITLSALAYDQGFGMEPVPAMYIPMALNSFGYQINGTTVYDVTTTIAVNAGDVVAILLACPMMRYATEATFTLSFVAGGGQGGNGGSTTPDGSSANPYVIDALPYTINFYGGMDEYYTYTPESDGTIIVTALEGAILSLPNGEAWDYDANNNYAIPVTAGQTLVLNPWTMLAALDGSMTVSYQDGQGGGSGSGSTVDTIFELGDNAAVLAAGDADGETFTFTAAESGDLTVELTALAYDQGFGMEPVPAMYIPMAMNNFALQVNDQAVYAPTTTIAVNAGDVVTVVFACPMMRYAAEATFTLSLVAGGGQGGGSTTPDGSSANPYVIDALPYTINFYGGMDEYYTYTAESDGTIIVTALEGAILSLPNGEAWDYDANNNYAIPVTAGQTLVLNPWTMQPALDGSMVVSYQDGQGGGGTSGESVPVQSGTESVTDVGAIEFLYTPDTDGVLTVNISADPGFRFWVYDAATDESLTLPENGTAGEYTYNLEAGVTYRIYMIGYYNWGEAAATITYDVSFKAAELNVTPVDIDKSTVVLELGANTVDLLENTIVSLYEFVPAEPGIYTITVGDGVTMATYGFSAWNLIAEAQNGVIVHTATDAEQTILVGLTADTASVTVTIEKTGNYTPPAQIVYENYVPTNTVVSNFTDPTNLVNIDINKEQNVVLGSDGYYHLGTADGPIVYVNLNNEQFTLAILYAAGAPITMRGTYVDEAGNEYHYDFMNMITSLYYDYSQGNDYHPLNKDLMIFLKAYGTSQGWYNANTSSFAAINGGEFKAESAWLASCYSTVSYVEPGPGAGNDTGNGGNGGTDTGNGPVTGDNSPLVLMFALMAVSAGAILVIASKKKYAR